MAPDALEDGHAPLRRLALIRQAKGGKKPSAIEKLKKRGGKTPLDELLNAEFLMAKDPDNLSYAESVLKACVAGGYTRTADWIAQLIFDANRASSRPALSTYLLLKDSYAKLNMFSKAVAACNHALELKPSDDALRDELRDLSASMTMEKGKYGQAQDFRDSIKDKETQDRLHSQAQTIKSDQYRQSAVEQARAQVQQAPTVTNILQLAQALVELEDPQARQESLNLLEQSYAKTNDFSFKRKEGELRIRTLKDDIRKCKHQAQQDPANQDLRSLFQRLVKQLEEAELEHYRLCSENYPTDLKFKYEYGRCLLKAHRFDEAIPLFQDAQRDPRLKVAAMDKTGLCFLLKGWFEDAIDLFKEAIKNSPTQESATAKDIKYNLARAYEVSDQLDLALEMYRKLAQIDFSYKDVSQRIDKIRSERHNGGSLNG